MTGRASTLSRIFSPRSPDRGAVCSFDRRPRIVRPALADLHHLLRRHADEEVQLAELVDVRAGRREVLPRDLLSLAGRVDAITDQEKARRGREDQEQDRLGKCQVTGCWCMTATT